MGEVVHLPWQKLVRTLPIKDYLNSLDSFYAPPRDPAGVATFCRPATRATQRPLAQSAGDAGFAGFSIVLYIPAKVANHQVIPWLTIAQLAEHLTVDEKSRYQSVLGSIPSGETATETCMTKIFLF